VHLNGVTELDLIAVRNPDVDVQTPEQPDYRADRDDYCYPVTDPAKGTGKRCNEGENSQRDGNDDTNLSAP
jgi:hypothetical protein